MSCGGGRQVRLILMVIRASIRKCWSNAYLVVGCTCYATHPEINLCRPFHSPTGKTDWSALSVALKTPRITRFSGWTSLNVLYTDCMQSVCRQGAIGIVETGDR